MAVGFLQDKQLVAGFPPGKRANQGRGATPLGTADDRVGTTGRAPSGDPHRVTGLLLQWGGGDEAALNELIPLVHDELRRIARRCMAGERRGHSLQATALVNEAYLRLVDVQRVNWQNRTHFLAMSARLMRRILVDVARKRRFQKRGGGAIRVTLGDAMAVAERPEEDLAAIDDALHALGEVDERKARVVELRYFGGLSVEETAAVLEVSEQTVMRDWKFAKAWLSKELGGMGSRGKTVALEP